MSVCECVCGECVWVCMWRVSVYVRGTNGG